jgi:glycosyltransferase involved in cell wall biosynthesis
VKAGQTVRFSVITPSYNQGQFLEQTLRSVANQEGPSEHIVMDGGSTDSTVALLKRYESRLGYWQSQRDGGQTDALNHGVVRATGDVVGWINSDDFYLPGAFEAVRQRFLAPDRPDVVFGYMVYVDEQGAPIREYRFPDPTLRGLIGAGCELSQQALFWRREVTPAVFPLPTGLKFCMDFELFCRLAARGLRFGRVSRFLGAFRMQAAAKSLTIASRGREEHAAVAKEYRHMNGPLWNALPRPFWLVRRRLEFLRRGEFRYAFLGGRAGMSREARELALAARAWQSEQADNALRNCG